MKNDSRTEISFNIKKKGKKKALVETRASGDEWARTTDSRIFSPMLYQLSYITAESDAKVGICYFCTNDLNKKIEA